MCARARGTTRYYPISRIRQTLNWLSTGIRKLDRDKIIVYKIPYTSSFDYYPVEIALFALGNLEKFLDTGEERYREVFIRHVDWLVKNISIKDDFGVWEHNFVLPYYKFDRVPWVHGMAQGVAISALVRAYQLTGNKKYLEVAKLAYGAFERDIDEGGVRYVDSRGDIWIEEYAILPPPHILNGFIYAMLGMYDLYSATKSVSILNLINECKNTLVRNLHKYDNGFWSLYDLLNKFPSSKKYHELHIEQLNVLYSLTGEDIFKEYMTIWRNYLTRSSNRIRKTFVRLILYTKKYGLTIPKMYVARKKWEKK